MDRLRLRVPTGLRTMVAMCAFHGFALVSAQTPPPKPAAVFNGRLVGVYDRDTGEPVDSAEVRDILTGHGALTSRSGLLTLFFVDTGGSLIRVRKVGYEPFTMLVANSLRDTIPLTIAIQRLATAQTLAPVVVRADSTPQYRSPRLRGFEERRRESMGRFISEAELRKEDNRQLGNVLAAHFPIGAVRKRGKVLAGLRAGWRELRYAPFLDARTLAFSALRAVPAVRVIAAIVAFDASYTTSIASPYE